MILVLTMRLLFQLTQSHTERVSELNFRGPDKDGKSQATNQLFMDIL
ncbi:MAG: hypothetical protein HC883_01535 [Bdellovibrionaceae bacterium]|nr:hypothetical protein [Pseudobdellovibrionaceae bacterium]